MRYIDEKYNDEYKEATPLANIILFLPCFMLFVVILLVFAFILTH